ncbi:hypothetical protein, partial [Litorivivens sp.]|uniref:hypothetical protein n=1 Tax=Litorivivens sp. TaxID=2020868 RepID=UPI00356AE101
MGKSIDIKGNNNSVVSGDNNKVTTTTATDNASISQARNPLIIKVSVGLAVTLPALYFLGVEIR